MNNIGINNNSISVAMATYNGEKYIKEQLDSIICQLSPEDEIIISDDGSTDNTIQIINDYIEKYKNIKLIDGPREGIVKNFENALKQCNNRYVFLSDQDDIWCDNKKETVISKFDGNIDLIVHDASIIDKNGKQIMPSWFEFRKSGKGFLKNLVRNTYIGCCMAFDSKLLNKIIPIPNIEMHDWWIGLISESYGKPLFINDKLLKYRRHETNASHKNNYSLLKMFLIRFNLLKNVMRCKKK